MNMTNKQHSGIDHDEKSTLNIGLIGMGDMGKLYATTFFKKGWKNIHICDLPEKYEALKSEFPHFNTHHDGHGVSRISDFIIYSVEAKNIEQVVSRYGPSTKVDAVVGGQTSVKSPEIQAFEKFLPEDVNIITFHSLHGPKVSPEGQPLVFIPHRCTVQKSDQTRRVLESLESQFVELSYEEHDRITADTQAVTHLAFKSMGTAWKSLSQYPWEHPTYAGGIENVKIAMMLRIYSNKWHVYAGLAIMNPAARLQIQQYSKSVSELFKLMIKGEKDELLKRVGEAKTFVFGRRDPNKDLLLSDRLLNEHSLSNIPAQDHKPNSHLSLLAMVDCWYQLNINPYDHLICQTPPFRLWLGIAEYLFLIPKLLEEALYTGLYAQELRGDDFEFCSAAQGWCQVILVGSFEAYMERFKDTQAFFEHRLIEGSKLSAKLIETVKEQMKQKNIH